MRTKGIIRACLLISGIFAAAAAANAQTGPLDAKRWSLAEMNGRAMNGSRAFVEFDVREGRLAGNAGCNKIFGDVAVGRSSISISEIGSTRMACPEMQAEAEMLDALRKVTRYRVFANNLTLFAGSDIVLRFFGTRKEANGGMQRPSLEDRKWLLTAIRGHEIGTLPEAPFLNFDQGKKSAGGNTGCNVFGGNYETSGGGRVRFFELISTMRACIEDRRMEIEREFLGGLREADRYRLAGNRLDLFRGTELLLTFRGTAR